MWPRKLVLLSLVLGSPFLPVASRSAHAGGGAVVAGTVKLAGPVPKPALVKVTKDAASCGADYASESVRVDPEGHLANAVVTLKAKAPRSGNTAQGGQGPAGGRATLDQVGCRYLPHVQAVSVGTELTLINSDRVLHNVHGNQGPVTVFNLAMPLKGQRLPTKLTRPGLVRLQCDAGHTWMNAWILVADHPHHAVTDAAGNFEIRDVPAGEYTLEVWHEPVDGKGPGTTQTSALSIGEGQTAVRVDIAFKL